MLVLTLKVSEVVIIDTPLGKVTVTLLERKGGACCRLGFVAPKSIGIVRQAVLDRQKKESHQPGRTPAQGGPNA